jgi:hypothetical protein
MMLKGDESVHPQFAEPDYEALEDGSAAPEVTPDELTPGLLRAAILNRGCLIVRGMVNPDESLRLAGEIDNAFNARDTRVGGGPTSEYYEEFRAKSSVDLKKERGWISDAAGVWAADSPKLMCEVIQTFEEVGLRRLIDDYLGERATISVNKCTLRRVKPDAVQGYEGISWHQDGAFLGDVRALNVWLSLSHCGDDAPGLDLIPKRLDHIVPTGTEGAAFDWSLSPLAVKEAAGDVPVQRPIFEPGDVVLFDELFLHGTGADIEMPNTRYAIESWFFGPSRFPEKYAPIAF